MSHDLCQRLAQHCPDWWHWLQAAKLKHQLTYEQRRNLKKDVEAARADLKKIQDNLERLQAQADAAAEASAALEDELSAEVGTHSTLLHRHFLP